MTDDEDEDERMIAYYSNILDDEGNDDFFL